MKTILLLIPLFFLSAGLLAQQETFDLVTYTPPAGWKKIGDGNGVIGYAITNESKNTYCQMAIYKSMTTMGGGVQLDFDTDWHDLIAKLYNVTNAPEAGPSTTEDGWDVKTGVATFEFSGIPSVAMLVTMSGHGKRISITILTNTENYQTKIEQFLDSVNPVTIEETIPYTPPAGVSLSTTAKSNTSIVGIWTVVRSDQSSYMVNNGVAGYIHRQYTFNADGTYINYIKTFSYFTDILLTKESGVYQVSGNTITITPKKSVIENYSRTNESDKWGKFLSSQKVDLETTTYQFTIEAHGIYNETKLILQSGTATKRDGPFDLDNKWFYKLPTRDTDFLKLP